MDLPAPFAKHNESQGRHSTGGVFTQTQGA